MNRRDRRRAQALGGSPRSPLPDLTKALGALQSLQGFSEVGERLQPVLDSIGPLARRLEAASAALEDARRENSELRSALDQQRQVFLRLCAQGMSISFEEVLSMEAEIRRQLPHESTPDADTSPEPNRHEQAHHPGSDTP